MGLFKAIGSFMFLKPHSLFLTQFPSNELWLSVLDPTRICQHQPMLDIAVSMKGGDTSHLQDHRKFHNLCVNRGSLTEWKRKGRYIFGILD